MSERERVIVVAASLITPVLVHKLKKFVDSNATKNIFHILKSKYFLFIFSEATFFNKVKFVRLVGFEP